MDERYGWGERERERGGGSEKSVQSTRLDNDDDGILTGTTTSGLRITPTASPPSIDLVMTRNLIVRFQ